MLPQTSLLVEKQLPQFIREDYPKFVDFLQKYYEFFELSTYSDTADYNGSTGDNNLLTADKTHDWQRTFKIIWI